MAQPGVIPLFAELTRAVADLDERRAMHLVLNLLVQDVNALQIVEACQEGLREVGLRYERREYFLAGLIMAGEIFRQVMALLGPILAAQMRGRASGRIIIGTVQGDIHDIGKNNLGLLLGSYGFEVIDLGVDVAPMEFLAQAEHQHPAVIGLSGLLTSSYDAMRTTIGLLRASPDTQVQAIPLVIGGFQLNEQVCRYVGADYWMTDAMAGVRLCQQLIAPGFPGGESG
jgi:methanogenic corrinoid protein MtbC1